MAQHGLGAGDQAIAPCAIWASVVGIGIHEETPTVRHIRLSNDRVRCSDLCRHVPQTDASLPPLVTEVAGFHKPLGQGSTPIAPTTSITRIKVCEAWLVW